MNAVGNSREVDSVQQAPHERLHEVVRRHLEREWREPLSDHSRVAYERVAARLRAAGGRLWFDSGCGTGESTLALAARAPDRLVVGIDKSAARLGRRLDDGLVGSLRNVLFVRAELGAFWRIAAAAGLRLERHFLLYPNPWPKRTQLKRRWHAHPAFAPLLALGGVLELRSNWRVYAQEMCEGLAVAGREARIDSVAIDEAGLSPFERKYRASGHALWRVSADLGA
jgi:tRNA (guanine-N7-)-methyltransferase